MSLPSCGTLTSSFPDSATLNACAICGLIAELTGPKVRFESGNKIEVWFKANAPNQCKV